LGYVWIGFEWLMYSLRVLKERGCFDLYESQYLEDYSGHSFQKKGRVMLNEVNKISMKRGDIFRLPSTQYHSVKKDNSKPADSIVITGDSEILSADVISNRTISCNVILKNTPVKSSFLREKLVSFMGRA
jgi:hypothetical protein